MIGGHSSVGALESGIQIMLCQVSQMVHVGTSSFCNGLIFVRSFDWFVFLRVHIQ